MMPPPYGNPSISWFRNTSWQVCHDNTDDDINLSNCHHSGHKIINDIILMNVSSRMNINKSIILNDIDILNVFNSSSNNNIDSPDTYEKLF